MSLQSLKQRLGIQIANAATVREIFDTSCTTAKAATTIVLEAKRLAEESLQSLTEMQAGLEALGRKAKSTTVHTPVRMKLVLTNYIDKFKTTQKEQEKSIDDAWKAWQDATCSIAQAGNARDKHNVIFNQLKHMTEGTVSREYTRYILGARSAIEKQNDELFLMLQETVNSLQKTLKIAPRILNAHMGAWDAMEKEVQKAVDAAALEIARL